MAVELNPNIKGAGVADVLQQAKQRDLEADRHKDDPEEIARKRLAKKIAIKKERLKQGAVQKETFSREKQVNEKLKQIMGGAEGPEAADALKNWQGDQDIQKKLTEAQKKLFREAMAKNPKKATQGAKALANLAKSPEAQQAVKNSSQMGVLQKAVLDNPQLEKQAGEILKNRFMQAPKSDPQTKGRFLEFGLRQAQKSRLAAVKQAGDLLGTLSKGNIGRAGQRATMNMVQRQPGDEKAMANVDALVRDPNFGKMPNFARTKGTELAAKANGKGEVTEGFTSLAGDGTFKAQTAQNKGRFFATIGTGRPSEYRALSDSLLTSLQTPGFPKRSGQVKRLLGEIQKQVTKSGAQGVDTKAAMKSSKASPMPQLRLVPMDPENMDEEELAQARSQNRANVMQFYNKLSRLYEGGEKKLRAAKFLEDVNQLQSLRAPPEPDTSALTPEEQAFLQERHASVLKRYSSVATLQRQRARELRTKRRRGGKKGLRRARGKQTRYFSPRAMRTGTAAEAFLQTAGSQDQRGLSLSPQRAAMTARSQQAEAAGSSIAEHVESALKNLGGGSLTADKAGQVAQAIAAQVAQKVALQVTQQVTESLIGTAAAGHLEPAEPQPPAAAQRDRTQQGKVDGWGIPRTFERDLGGASREPVKAPGSDGQSFAEAVQEKYTGKTLIKDPASIRDLGTLFATTWKELGKGEMALLKNLGWNQQLWDTKNTKAAKWPGAMMTPFVNLTPVQREAVRQLGFTPHDWDKKVQAFSSGRNA